MPKGKRNHTKGLKANMHVKIAVFFINILFSQYIIANEQENFAEDIYFFQDFANKNKINSVSGFLDALYKQKDSLDEKYRLKDEFHAIYKSFGSNLIANDINNENPRILLEINDTILAFTGNPKGKFTEKYIEAIAYNKNQNELDLYTFKIEEPKNGSKDYFTVHKNPSYCLGCHTSYTQNGKPFKPNGKNRIRYIWDSYFVWPGYYGSHNGILIGNEIEQYKKFLEISKTNPIYNKLPKERMNRKLFEEAVPQAQMFPIGIRYILADLGGLMFKLQQNIVISDIKQNMNAYRYAIIGAVGCPDENFPIASFVPDNILKKQPFPEYQSVLEDTVKLTNEDFAKRIALIKLWTNATDSELRRSNNFVKYPKTYNYERAWYDSPEMTALTARLRFIVDTIWEPGLIPWTMAPFKNIETGSIEPMTPNHDYTFAHGRFNFEDLNYWSELLDEKIDKELILLLNQDKNEMKIKADHLKEEETHRLNELLARYADSDQLPKLKIAISAKLEELKEQPDIQVIWNYEMLTKAQEGYLNSKEYSGYKITPTRKEFCQKLRAKSLQSLNDTEIKGN